MKFLFALAALTSLVAAAPKASKTSLSIAKPGTAKDIIITEENTINGTYTEDKVQIKKVKVMADSPPIHIVNNFGGGALKMYVTGLDQGRVVFVGPNNQLIYPSSGGSGTPVPIQEPIAHDIPGQGSDYQFALPIPIDSGRIYISEGDLQFFMVIAGDGKDGLVTPSIKNLQDPASGTNFGFSEFTWTTDGVMWTNISFVDFVGLILSLRLSSNDGTVQEVKGLEGGAVPDICNDLVAQESSDGRAWGAHCVRRQDGSPIRVLSPESFTAIDSSAFADYYSGYVDQAWERFRSEPLVIHTQGPAGDVTCGVQGDTLTCDQDNRGYGKPTTFDIWGCNSGPFGKEAGDNDVHLRVIPRLCAAFYRTTMLLAGGEVQPSLPASSYYTHDPTSHYSRSVHAHEVDGKGYAFSYDDVNPDGSPDSAGLVSTGNPSELRFFVGGLA